MKTEPRGGILIAVIVLYWLVLPSVGQSDDWPQWRGPDRSGVTSQPSGWNGTTWNLRLDWQVDVGPGMGASPIIVGQKVYVMGYADGGTLSGQDKLREFTLAVALGREPITAIQDSWIANRVAGGEGTKVRAFWAGRDGKSSAESAVTSSATGFFVGHVLTQADQANKDRLIQEMIGELWPGMWEETYKFRLARLGVVAGFKSLAELEKAMLANAASDQAKQVVDMVINAHKASVQEAAATFAGRKTPLMPGIGATLGPSPDGTLQQVLIARKHGAAGFVLFNYNRALFDHLDLLKLGATMKGSVGK